MVGAMGFEPMMPTLKVWCLTTWPRSDNTMRVYNRNDVVAVAVFTFQHGTLPTELHEHYLF